MQPGSLLGLLLAPALLAQSQPTFYAAYQDGLDAEHRGAWSAAAAAYRRAIELRPASVGRVVIYGNNLLLRYYPYTRLAYCELELGHRDTATALLVQAAAQGEPAPEREGLLHRLAPPPAQATPPSAPIPHPMAVTTPQTLASPSPPENPPPTAPPPTPREVLPAPLAQPGPPAVATRAMRETRPPAPWTTAPIAPLIPSPAPAPAPISTTSIVQKPRREGLLLASLGVLLAGGGWFLLRRRRPAVEPGFRDPDHLGPYRIERLLGRGGFASTYLARHETKGRSVALKVLHPYRQDDPEFLGRFRQEARLGALLEHPNIVRLLDPGPEEGTPYLAMEYVSGRRLDRVLREDGPPSLPDLLRLAQELASGMAYAHTHGVVHRDLKPGNIMLEDGHIKIMDFGISRVVDSETLTTTYAFLGTPLYAAPEAQTKTQVGPAADRYSFGVLLFELLAGHPPFKGETPFEILDQHRSATLPDLRTLRPDTPVVLVELIERLCRKEPAERPEDGEILERLARLAE